MRLPRSAILLPLFAAGPSHILAAQSLWSTPFSGKGEIGLEWTRPSFEINDGLGDFRGVWIATGRFRVGQHGALVFAVPYLKAGDEAIVGNPYVGYEQAEQEGRSTLIAGIRFPHAEASFGMAQSLAFRGDYDRLEEALPNALTLRVEGQTEAWRDQGGADVRVRGGLSILHNTDPAAGADATEYFLDYGVRFGRTWTKLDLGLAFTGRWFLSANGGTFSTNTTGQATADLKWHGKVAPMVGFRLPVDEPLKTVYKSALIFGLTVALP